jgi:hypothetical protein
MDSHPEIACGREILYTLKSKPLKKYVRKTTLRILGYYLYRKKVLYGFLDEFYANYTEMKAVGFKFMYSQARFIPYRFPMILSYVRDKNIKVIHNFRDNLLKTHLSRVNAQLKKRHHASQKMEFEKIYVHVSGLLPTLRRMLEEQRFWREKLQHFETFEVIYEDLVQNRERTVSSLIQFIGVKTDVTLQSPLEKISPDLIEDIASNYDEIVVALKGTYFERFLD